MKQGENIKAVVFDGIGVFFSECVYIHPEHGERYAMRSHVDGQGISLLRAAGIRVALATSEKIGFTKMMIDKLNSLPSVKEETWYPIELIDSGSRVERIGEWLASFGATWDECAYMGDDLGDYEPMKKAGLAAAPVQAEQVIKKIAHYVAPRRGGDGAIRDLCNLILEAKGIDPVTLPLK